MSNLISRILKIIPGRRRPTNFVVDAWALLRLSIPFLILLIGNFIVAWLVSRQMLQALGDATAFNQALAGIVLQLMHDTVNTLIFGLNIIGFLSFVLWLIVSHRIFGPIVPIRRHIEKLRHGIYEDRIVLRKGDELKDIASDLNQLTETLKASSGENGQSLVQVLVAMAVSSILILALLSITTMLENQQQQANFIFQAGNVKTTLYTLINNSNSWTQTYGSALNPTLNCFQTRQPCTTNGQDYPNGTAIGTTAPVAINAVLDASGNIFYDSTNPQAGFTPQGTPCTGFVRPPGQGNRNCPLRFDVTWQAACNLSAAPPTCVNPQPKIWITAVYNPGATRGLAFNPANYSTPSQGFVQGSGAVAPCWVQGPNGLYETSSCGNVGIGTASPTAPLSIGPITAVGVNTVSMGQTPQGGLDQFDLANTTGNAYLYAFSTGSTSASIGAFQAPSGGGGSGTVGSCLSSCNQICNNLGNTFPNNLFTCTQNCTISCGGNICPPQDTINNGICGPPQNGGGGGGAVSLLLNERGGNVGIATTNPQYALDVSSVAGSGDINIAFGGLRIAGQSICFNDGAGNVGCRALPGPSDIRLKTNVQPLDHALENILSLKGISYDWKNPEKYGKGQQVGVIAQEVEKVYPQIVSTNPNTGFKAVYYERLIAPIIEAVKSLASGMENLRRENVALKTYLCAKDPGAQICRP